MFLRTLLAATAALSLAVSAQAADVYVVHGINGTDIGQPEAVPVDVNVGGGNLLNNVPFKAFAGPFDVGVGPTDIEIRLTDGGGTGTLVATGTFDFALFETAVVVAHLDPNGTIRLSKFTVDTGDLGDGEARLAIAHAAAAPPVDLQLRGVNGTKGAARLRGLTNGDSTFPAVVGEGDYRVVVRSPGFVKGTVAKLDEVGVAGNVVVIAVGTVANGTFDVILLPIGAEVEEEA